ncbi:LPXTG cell wall anchor domain-containing protein [Streptomyces xanthophaeus]|uniref:LPXTG cell wall anchor domain-containing protein n=1 Tax=Streptomyces xanthophaeus TaxID=67385 RepID=UPI003654FE5F
MRTAARTATATAVLVGALLAPAGAAFAATPLNAAPAAASSSDPDRYSGTPVFIDAGLLAVLRHTSSGPEARIRAYGPEWNPGDAYIGEALAVLDDAHRSRSVRGLQLELVKSGTGNTETLVVTKDGRSTSYDLPKGQGGTLCTTRPVHKILGRGLEADLTMSPDGPVASLYAQGSRVEPTRLDRNNPAKEEYTVRILNPNSAEPVLEWKLQNGAPWAHAAFPKLHTGCTPNYTLQKPTQKPQPETKPSAKPSAKPTVAPSATPSTTPSATAAAPKAQTAGQTSVVPKGGVAAGAEIAGGTTTGDTDSTTALAGAGLGAVLAALGASVLLRRRRAQG